MREKFKHINSKDETLDFLSLGITINYNDMRDYEWMYNATNDKITSFSKGIVKKTIPFIFYCSETEATNIKNRFYEHFEKDVLNLQQGYFLINDYRLYGYVTKSVKSNYLSSKRLLYLTIEFTCENANWVKENKHPFYSSKTNDDDQGSTKTYPYKYSYTYGKSKGKETFYVDSLKSCEFKMIVYGSATNPQITINEHLYNVNVSLNEREYLVVDSRNKEIYKVANDGTKTNVFEFRNLENYIFEPMKSGANTVVWSDGFLFDLYVFEERSEPRWD